MPVFFPAGSSPSGFGPGEGVIILHDEKGSGVQGGTATAGSWETRNLNTEVADTGGHASLAANQFTLAAGTYECIASSPAFATNGHQIRLRNVTDAATVATGTTEYAYDAAGQTSASQTRSWLAIVFTIAAAKTFEIQHQVETTRGTNGHGDAQGFGTNVYTIVRLRKIA